MWFFVWCGSGPVLCCFGEAQIWPGDLRVVAVAVFLFVVLVFPWFASFVKPKGFILFAHFYTASLTVRTEP